jgi:lysophospholipase L1-like esterase
MEAAGRRTTAGLVGLVSSFGLAPLWLAQGVYLRRTMERLAPAPEPAAGAIAVGEDGPLRVAVLGESTAAGVGVSSHVEGLSGQLASALHARLCRPVEWFALGHNGARLASVRKRLAPKLGEHAVDLVFLVVGVNDSIKLTTVRTFRAELRALCDDIRATRARLVISSVPPLGRFPRLPQPLRFVLGARAELLDEELRRGSERRGDTIHVPVDFPIVDDMFARDGFHPSETGYRVWAAQLGNAACDAYPDLSADVAGRGPALRAELP